MGDTKYHLDPHPIWPISIPLMMLPIWNWGWNGLYPFNNTCEYQKL